VETRYFYSMRVLLLVLVIGLGVGAYFLFSSSRHEGNAPRAEVKTEVNVSDTADKMKDGLHNAWDNLSLKTEEIKDELARDGKVVRTKAKKAGAALADAAGDAKITAAIKGKYVAEPDLSALSIAVSTTDGVVTLSGKVASPEQVKRAMQIALDTDGVRQVVSTIQLSPAK
jgi:hypothetical protein